MRAAVSGFQPQTGLIDGAFEHTELSGILHRNERLSGSPRPAVTFRQVCLQQCSNYLTPKALHQAGDSAILVEYGDMHLDFVLRARVHALESEVRKSSIHGIWVFAPCIRSTMVSSVSRQDVLIGIVVSVITTPW